MRLFKPRLRNRKKFIKQRSLERSDEAISYNQLLRLLRFARNDNLSKALYPIA